MTASQLFSDNVSPEVFSKKASFLFCYPSCLRCYLHCPSPILHLYHFQTIRSPLLLKNKITTELLLWSSLTSFTCIIFLSCKNQNSFHVIHSLNMLVPRWDFSFHPNFYHHLRCIQHTWRCVHVLPSKSLGCLFPVTFWQLYCIPGCTVLYHH